MKKHLIKPTKNFACGCMGISLWMLAAQAKATIILNPSITGGSIAYGESVHNAGTYGSANVFNGNFDDYASYGQGVNTYLEFSFGSSVTFDSIVVVNRDSPAGDDLVANYTLTYDSGSYSVTRTGGRGQGGIDYVGSVTTSTVRLDVDTLVSSGGGNNTGFMEIYFLHTPAGMTVVPGITVTLASNNPFGGGYAATNALNGTIGRDNGTEFASDALTNTFVDFDLGAETQVGAFDFFDRMAADAKVSAFDMIFSTDSVFGNGDDVTRSYTGSTQSDEFSAILARYVRYDVTSVSGTNVGMNEIRFYAVPEPSITLLGSFGVFMLLRRRRL